MTYTVLMILIGIAAVVTIIVRSGEYSRGENAAFSLMAFFILWLPLSIIPTVLIGFHHETGRGEHVGYITSVQKQGVFFKTGRAYLKTDTQSSQEDAYCVIDDKVYDALWEKAKTKEHVSVKYFRWFSSGISNCGGEGDVIYEVSAL